MKIKKVLLPLIWLYNLGVKPFHSELYKTAYFAVKVLVVSIALFIVLLILFPIIPAKIDEAWRIHTFAPLVAECGENIDVLAGKYDDSLPLYSHPDFVCINATEPGWTCRCLTEDTD